MKKNKLILSIIGITIFLLGCKNDLSHSQTLESGNIAVTVDNSSGSGIDGATIILSKIYNGYEEKVSEINTDSTGYYQFKNLQPGRYNIVATGKLLNPVTRDVSVNNNETDKESIKLTKFSGKIRLLSYNVRDGFSQDTNKENTFIQWVKKEKPDIICYQELNHFTPYSLEQFAAKFGHPYSVLLKENGYPVGISSKYPITDVKRVLKGFVHGYIYAKILGINVFAIHLSPTTLQSRIDEMTLLVPKVKALPDSSLTFIAGDYNSYSKHDEVAFGPDFEEVMLKRNPAVPVVDFTVTNMLVNIGFKDAYYLHNSTYKVSCPTLKYQSGVRIGWRYDYVYLSPKLSEHCTYADIIHDNVTDSLSDHYPTIVDFQFNN